MFYLKKNVFLACNQRIGPGARCTFNTESIFILFENRRGFVPQISLEKSSFCFDWTDIIVPAFPADKQMPYKSYKSDKQAPSFFSKCETNVFIKYNRATLKRKTRSITVSLSRALHYIFPKYFYKSKKIYGRVGPTNNKTGQPASHPVCREPTFVHSACTYKYGLYA